MLNSKPKSKGEKKRDFAKGVCPRCGSTTEHIAKACPHIKSTCHFCQKMGHLQSVCLKKKKEDRGSVMIISRHALRTVKSINSILQVKQSVWVSGQQLTFEVDTRAGDNFWEETWSTCTHTSLQSLSSGQWATSSSTWHLQSFSLSSKGPGTSNISIHCHRHSKA